MSELIGILKIDSLKIRMLFKNNFVIEDVLNNLPLKFIELYDVERTRKGLTFIKDDIKYIIENNDSELYCIVDDYELIDIAKVLMIEIKENILQYIDNEPLTDLQEIDSEVEIILPINFEDMINKKYFGDYIKYFDDLNITYLNLSTSSEITEFKIQLNTLIELFNLRQTRLPLFDDNDLRVSQTVLRRLIRDLNKKIRAASNEYFSSKDYNLYKINIKAKTLYDSRELVAYLIETLSYDIEEVKTELYQYITILRQDLKNVIEPQINHYPPKTRMRILRNFSIPD